MDTNGHTILFEDYVSFEIAKLLKEKGFDEYCLKNYWSDKELHNWKWELSYNKNSDANRNTRRYAAPTLQMTLKWLREVHDLHIDVFIGSDESYDADGVMADEWHFWTYYITNTNGDMIYDAYNEVDVIEHQTHEEAVEAAILYVLKNLI